MNQQDNVNGVSPNKSPDKKGYFDRFKATFVPNEDDQAERAREEERKKAEEERKKAE